MLLRLRIEAEGSTVNEVEEDFFATYDALIQIIYGPEVVPQTKLVDENIKSVAAPNNYHARWYRGSAVVVFPKGEGPGGGGVDHSRIRPRVEWLAAQDKAYWDNAIDPDTGLPVTLPVTVLPREQTTTGHSIVRIDHTGDKHGGVISLVDEMGDVVAQHTGSMEAAESLAASLNCTWTHVNDA